MGATAVVNIRVNTAYDDSGESLQMLETLAFYAPVRRIPVLPGDKLAVLFVREYGFGVSDLPKSYALLEKSILDKNHLLRPEDLRPGTLIVPAVPKRVWMDFGRNNPVNYMANMSVFRAEAATAASNSANRSPVRAAVGLSESEPPEVAYTKFAFVGERRKTAPYELLSFQAPLSSVDRLLDAPQFKAGSATAGTYPMPVKLAAEYKCDTEPASRDHQALTPAQRARISQILSTQRRRAPMLFILDTGWPSFSAYQESRAAIYELLDSVWKAQFGLGFPKRPAQRTMDRAANGHCRCIERALQQLRALDQDAAPGKRIRIVYIPLTREQGASAILTDLLQTSILLQRGSAENVALTQSMIDGARKRATEIVMTYFPSRWSGEEVQTDKSVLDAILLIGQAYAEAGNTLFFASESWTVQHGEKYHVLYDAPQYGMIASATGNDGTANLLDFAQRSISAKDTMAIMNMTSTGVDETSTRIEEQDIDTAVAVGFDGLVTDDISGTSFAAPRVAWFLAAGEAVRNKALNRKRWAIALPEQLRAMRDPKASRYQKLFFDPVRYIEAQIITPDMKPH